MSGEGTNIHEVSRIGVSDPPRPITKDKIEKNKLFVCLHHFLDASVNLNLGKSEFVFSIINAIIL